MFVRSSHAIALFPGGFGTMDEGFEVLTLVQTGKSVPTPIVFVDTPKGDYWKQWQAYVEDQLLSRALINQADLRLYKIVDNVNDAVVEIRQFYSNYHSIRYTRDQMVVRLHHPLTDVQLKHVRREYADICSGGTYQISGPLPVERDEPSLASLARLVFPFNRRDHGRLRILIDYLNDLHPLKKG
jgi:hypothetical protein